MSTKQTIVKSKLFKLREWLTLPETARHLSLIFDEEVNEADVLRLALDGHLKLSVNFVIPVYGKCGKLSSYEDKELPQEFLALLSATPDEKKKEVIRALEKIWAFGKTGPFGDQFLDLEDKLTGIEGIWDLSMTCGQQYAIEHEYQMLTGGPQVTSPIVGAAYVVREGGQVCRLYVRFDESWEYETEQGMKKLEFKNESDRYYPAVDLPSDSIFVVRTQALIDLQESLVSEGSLKNDNLGSQVYNPFFDTNHTFFAKELRIALEAWTELYEINPPQHAPKGGHKKYISKWLDEKYSDLGQRARERIATVINPNPKGGASPI